MLYNKLFKDFLVKNGVMNEAKSQSLLKEADKNNVLLYEYLIEKKALSEEDSFKNLAKFLNTEFIKVDPADLNISSLRTFPKNKIINYGLVPCKETDDRMTFAISNPLRLEELNEFKINTKKRFDYSVITKSNMKELVDFINENYDLGREEPKEEIKEVKEEIKMDTYREREPQKVVDTSYDKNTVNLCNDILENAISRDVDTIHLDLSHNEGYVRFRVQGKLLSYNSYSKDELKSAISRFKRLAMIPNSSSIENGTMVQEFDNSKFNFRVSALPTINGDKLVIKVFNLDLEEYSLSNIGLDDSEQDTVDKILSRGSGLVLLAGQSRSGKSTTMNTFLKHLDAFELNIVTLEKSVESRVLNASQSEYKSKESLIKSLQFLKGQDADVVLIDEVNDKDVLRLAYELSIDNKLVITSISSLDTSSAILRLEQLGLSKKEIADSLSLVVTQRLIRTLCPNCKLERKTTSDENDMLAIKKVVDIFDPVGCDDCHNTGYQSRVALFDLLVVDDATKDAIVAGEYTDEKVNADSKQYAANYISKTRNLVLDGETSMEEYEKIIDLLLK
ncbi:MAG: Flp pilus assembly complex ATPase component TadA [Gammaproteobacteria bacterium]|nr:Flp pilus assembly complex ATPase component TadA [Gammaproteobacteria bacterium]